MDKNEMITMIKNTLACISQSLEKNKLDRFDDLSRLSEVQRKTLLDARLKEYKQNKVK